jgi:hypothetical protein
VKERDADGHYRLTRLMLEDRGLIGRIKIYFRVAVSAFDVLEALCVAHTALSEIHSARRKGPEWFSQGKNGQQNHIELWISKGMKKTALYKQITGEQP